MKHKLLKFGFSFFSAGAVNVRDRNKEDASKVGHERREHENTDSDAGNACNL